MSIAIPGLPEGVVCTHLGIAKPNEYEIIDGKIYQGKREGTTSQIIVEPAQGWKFRARRDVRGTGEKYFVPAKPVDLHKVTVEFVITDTYEQAEVAAVVDALKSVPGYVDPDAKPVAEEPAK